MIAASILLLAYASGHMSFSGSPVIESWQDSGYTLYSAGFLDWGMREESGTVKAVPERDTMGSKSHYELDPTFYIPLSGKITVDGNYITNAAPGEGRSAYLFDISVFPDDSEWGVSFAVHDVVGFLPFPDSGVSEEKVPWHPGMSSFQFSIMTLSDAVIKATYVPDYSGSSQQYTVESSQMYGSGNVSLPRCGVRVTSDSQAALYATYNAYYERLAGGSGFFGNSRSWSGSDWGDAYADNDDMARMLLPFNASNKWTRQEFFTPKYPVGVYATPPASPRPVAYTCRRLLEADNVAAVVRAAESFSGGAVIDGPFHSDSFAFPSHDGFVNRPGWVTDGRFPQEGAAWGGYYWDILAPYEWDWDPDMLPCNRIGIWWSTTLDIPVTGEQDDSSLSAFTPGQADFTAMFPYVEDPAELSKWPGDIRYPCMSVVPGCRGPYNTQTPCYVLFRAVADLFNDLYGTGAGGDELDRYLDNDKRVKAYDWHGMEFDAAFVTNWFNRTARTSPDPEKAMAGFEHDRNPPEPSVYRLFSGPLAYANQRLAMADRLYQIPRFLPYSFTAGKTVRTKDTYSYDGTIHARLRAVISGNSIAVSGDAGPASVEMHGNESEYSYDEWVAGRADVGLSPYVTEITDTFTHPSGGGLHVSTNGIRLVYGLNESDVRDLCDRYGSVRIIAFNPDTPSCLTVEAGERRCTMMIDTGGGVVSDTLELSTDGDLTVSGAEMEREYSMSRFDNFGEYNCAYFMGPIVGYDDGYPLKDVSSVMLAALQVVGVKEGGSAGTNLVEWVSDTNSVHDVFADVYSYWSTLAEKALGRAHTHITDAAGADPENPLEYAALPERVHASVTGILSGGASMSDTEQITFIPSHEYVITNRIDYTFPVEVFYDVVHVRKSYGIYVDEVTDWAYEVFQYFDMDGSYLYSDSKDPEYVSYIGMNTEPWYDEQTDSEEPYEHTLTGTNDTTVVSVFPPFTNTSADVYCLATSNDWLQVEEFHQYRDNHLVSTYYTELYTNGTVKTPRSLSGVYPEFYYNGTDSALVYDSIDYVEDVHYSQSLPLSQAITNDADVSVYTSTGYYLVTNNAVYAVSPDPAEMGKMLDPEYVGTSLWVFKSDADITASGAIKVTADPPAVDGRRRYDAKVFAVPLIRYDMDWKFMKKESYP